ncbi:isocitrate/isopropylmalate family dehydrogenase [Lonsdalea quercina]|uniref:isocitrate/isopropylmalate family dehydrogenase n=1 Tax=Lonsdalea quercina TaxID=71657 RepID=UPI003976B4DE
MKKVLVLPGDGIGQEVCEAALPVINALNLPIKLCWGDIGWECWKKAGDPIPAETWEKISQADAVLLGAITSKGKAEAQQALPEHLQNKNITYTSPVIQLRQKLGLFANIRPIKYVGGNRQPFRCCVIRENTEGLYSGLDFKGVGSDVSGWLKHPNLEKYGLDEAAWTVRLQTRFGLERLFDAAFNHAREHHFNRVTFADKPNVMRESGHFAATVFHEVASRFPDISADIQNIDAMALWLVRKPHEFGVIVAENMFGDILSDLAAGIMGGLGLAPSANLGSDIAYFEPVHGSAPGMAWKGKANPSAMFYTIAMMVEYLGFSQQAQRINQAVDHVIREGKTTTYDLGGMATTQQMAEAIIRAITLPTGAKTASVLTIGDELLSGQYLNSNQQHISQQLVAANYRIRSQAVCADNIQQIRDLIIASAGQDALIVVCGGLGPTSDDKTREAVANAIHRPLVHHENVWITIQEQLRKLGVKHDDSNRLQALFPSGASVLPNPSGTAPGFHVTVENTQVVVLPGPPSQALPMLEHYLSFTDKGEASSHNDDWMLIGISESEVGAKFEQLLPSANCDVHFLWKSPYILVRVETPLHSPLPQSIVAAADDIFRPYLVSKNNQTARERLRDIGNVRWRTADSALSACLQDENHTVDTGLTTEVEVAVAPPLAELLASDNLVGNTTMSIRRQDGKQYGITFPYNKTLLTRTLPEYAAWCVLNTLTIHNGPKHDERID